MSIRYDDSNSLTIFIISDSVGDTAQKVITAVLAQFPNVENIEIKKFPFIDSEEELTKIIRDAIAEKAVVVTTLVEPTLTQQLEEFSKKYGFKYIDFMSPLIDAIVETTHVEPKHEPRAQYKLNQGYFNRVEAIEFAVAYDDGRNPKGFIKSDYVILGTSRTSKTPLSMYLANKSIKVSNLPLIPEVPLPTEIYEVPKEKLIGLLLNPEKILAIRKTRLKSLGLYTDSNYSSIERIKAEIDYSKKVYEELGARVIQIDGMAIEEIAQLIENG